MTSITTHPPPPTPTHWAEYWTKHVDILSQAREVLDSPSIPQQQSLLCNNNSNSNREHNALHSYNSSDVQFGSLNIVNLQQQHGLSQLGTDSGTQVLINMLNKMDKKLQNIEGQLENQNQKWQNIECQLTNQNQRMNKNTK